AVARMERTGIPIDVAALARLIDNWERIQDRLIAEVDTSYGVYAGRKFQPRRFAEWLNRQGIPWRRLSPGRLDLSAEYFKEMARSYPEILPLQQLRASLSLMRGNHMPIGLDGRKKHATCFACTIILIPSTGAGPGTF